MAKILEKVKEGGRIFTLLVFMLAALVFVQTHNGHLKHYAGWPVPV